MTVRVFFEIELELRERIRAAILEAFEVVPDPGAIVRRTEVVQAVRDATGERDNNRLHNRVRQVVEGLGAEAIKPKNRSLFRKLRRRGNGANPAP